MRRALRTLIRVQVKDSLNRYSRQMGVKRKWLARVVMILPLLILLPTIEMIWLIAKGFGALGQPELTFTYVYVATVLLLFVTALPLLVSAFFYSKDLSLLASLPVRPREIVWSKLAVAYASLLLFSGSLLGTALGIYLVQAGFSLPVLLLGLLAVFLAPLLPMILAALLGLPFMALVGGRSNRNLLIVLGNLLLLGMILGIQILVTRTSLDPQALIGILTSPDGLLRFIGRGFPPSVWLTRMILGSLPDALLFLALNAASLLLLSLVAGTLYSSALKKYNEAGSSASKEAIRYRSGKIRTALVRRHLGILLGNPTFMLNGLLTIFVPVLIFVLYNLMGVMDLNTLSGPVFEPYRLYLYAGILLSPSIMGSLSATVISREGPAFWETRVLPVSGKVNLSARMASTVLLTGVGVATVGVLALLVLPMNLIGILVAAFAAAAGTLAMSSVDLLINVYRPHLGWTNPTSAVKNNLNVMLSLASRVVLAAPVAGIYLIAKGLAPEWVVLLAGGVFLLVWLGARAFLYGPGLERFRRIDV